MSYVDILRNEYKLSVMRDWLGGLWVYAASAIKKGDIGWLDYILKTGVIPFVQDLEAIDGNKSLILAKEVLDFVQYVEMAMASIQLSIDTKHVLERAMEASYDQDTDEFKRDFDRFIDGLDIDGLYSDSD